MWIEGCRQWKETYDDLRIDQMLAARALVDEVGRDAHDDDGAGPLHDARDQLERTSNGTGHHLAGSLSL